MSEPIIVVLSVGVVYGIFFYLAHRADQVVKAKAKQALEQSRSAAGNVKARQKEKTV